MDVAVFVKENHLQTGMHRFLESLTLFDGCEIVFVKSIEETNIDVEVGIYGGFMPLELKDSTVKIKHYVYCSPLGQADLSGGTFYAPEIQVLLQMFDCIKKRQITSCITQSKSLAYRFGFIFVPPVKLDIETHIQFQTERKNYGFLGNNFRKHKNVANQLAAISMLEPKEKIVVKNSDAYIYWKYLFDCEFKDLEHVSDEKYYQEISGHRLCFQCSFSEAFDYQAFEYCFMGIPTICSPSLYWYPIKRHVIKNIDNVENIKDIAQKVLDTEYVYQEDSEYLADWAKRFNKSNMNLLEQVYKKDIKK